MRFLDSLRSLEMGENSVCLQSEAKKLALSLIISSISKQNPKS